MKAHSPAWWRVLLQLNVLLGLAGASVVTASSVLAGGPPSFAGAFVGFALVFAVYNFDRIADDSPAEGRSTPQRAATVRRYRGALRIAVGGLLLLGLAVALAHGVRTLAWTLAFPLAGVAYVLPLLPLPRIRRMKDVPYLKCFYVALTWTTFVWIGVAFADLPIKAAVLFFGGFVGMRLFVSTYLGDIRDLEDDAEAGIDTIAARIGVRSSFRLLDGVHLASGIYLVVGCWIGVVPPAVVLLLPAAFAFGLYRLYRRVPQHHELIFELYDLEVALFGPLLVWLSC